MTLQEAEHLSRVINERDELAAELYMVRAELQACSNHLPAKIPMFTLREALEEQRKRNRV